MSKKRKFPYSEDDFENQENEKLAKMLKWSYYSLDKSIQSNSEELKGHQKDIEKLEEKLDERKTASQTKKDIRNLILKVSVIVSAITGAVLTFISEVLLKR